MRHLWVLPYVAACTGPAPKPTPATTTTTTTPPPAYAPALTWIELHGQRLGSVAFVGPGRHALLLATEDSIAVAVAPGRLATPWIKLASAPLPGRGTRWISTSQWAWSDARNELVGVIGAYGTGVVETGLAEWAPMHPGIPHLLVPITDRIAPASLQTFAISDDAHYAVGGNVEPSVFDLEARAPIGAPLAASWARCAAFSPKRVAIGVDAGVLLVSLARRTVTKLASFDDERIDALTFHPTKDVLVGTTALDHLVEWYAGEPAPIDLHREARGVAFSPDGEVLALVHEKTVTLLDAATRAPVAPPIALPYSYFDNESIPIAFSPDSRDLAIPLKEGGVGWVDLTPGLPRATPDLAWVHALARLPASDLPRDTFARDGSLAATVTLDGKPQPHVDVELAPYPHGDAVADEVPHLHLRTDAHGAVAADHLARIPWAIDVTAPGAQPYAQEVDLQHAAHAFHAVELARDVPFAGRVLDAAGKPAAGVRITVDRDVGLAPVVSDAAGAFAIAHLAGKPVQLFLYRTDGAAATATVTPGTAIELHLLAPHDPQVVQLAVVDAAGHPVPNADVSIGNVGVGATDEDGRIAAEVSGDRAEVSVWLSERAAWPPIMLPHPDVVTVTYRPGETW